MYVIKKPRLLNHHRVAALLLIAAAAGTAWGQSSQAGSGTRATQLPLSGSQQIGASVQQSANPSTAGSVSTLNTQIRVQGAYTGSVVDANPPTGTLALTLADAVRRGLQFNLGVVGAGDRSRQAEGQRLCARSSLLPSISASASENAAKISLEAEGLTSATFGSANTFPATAGPFHYYDIQG